MLYQLSYPGRHSDAASNRRSGGRKRAYDEGAPPWQGRCGAMGLALFLARDVVRFGRRAGQRVAFGEPIREVAVAAAG